MNHTSLEQSNKLINVGLNTNTADMYHWESEGKIYTYVGKCSDPNGVPCWTVDALINVLPTSIIHDDVFYQLVTFHDLGVIEYINLDKNEILYSSVWNALSPKTYGYIHGLYKMVLWCLKEGHIKKGE